MGSIGILRNAIQEYAWGSHSAIAELLGVGTPTDRPQAEMWMGAHPKAPSLIQREDRWVPLTEAISDDPGGLNAILNSLAREGISIEYMYGFLGKHEHKAVMIIRVEETQKAIELLLEDGFTLLKGEQIYTM